MKCGLSDADLIAKLRERYAPTVIPPCRVCGGKLSIGRAGLGMPTIWACSTWQETDDGSLLRKPGRGLGDKHYSDSVFTDPRQGGDAEVIELIKRFEDEAEDREDCRHSMRSAERILLCDDFEAWAEEWRSDPRVEVSSSVTAICMHPAYQRIIGRGPAVVPFILREMKRRPDHWFWALRAITGADPVAPEDAGNLDAMTAAWLAWGVRHHLIEDGE